MAESASRSGTLLSATAGVLGGRAVLASGTLSVEPGALGVAAGLRLGILEAAWALLATGAAAGVGGAPTGGCTLGASGSGAMTASSVSWILTGV